MSEPVRVEWEDGYSVERVGFAADVTPVTLGVSVQGWSRFWATLGSALGDATEAAPDA